MRIKIGVFGANGLIGKELVEFLRTEYTVIAIKSSHLYDTPEVLSEYLKGQDIIINLAGSSISGRWTQKKKNLIYNSRIDTVDNLEKAIKLLKNRPVHFINASAVGIYKDGIVSDENTSEYANNFLSVVVSDWEKGVKKIQELNVNVSIIRIGVVLSRLGGMYQALRKIFILGLGGRIGSGKQGFSFILLEDLIRIFDFVIKQNIYGVVNGVCPEPISNSYFTSQVGKILNRPVVFTVPEILLRIVLKEGSSLLLEGQKVVPSRLEKEGFVFHGTNLKTCLEILEK